MKLFRVSNQFPILETKSALLRLAEVTITLSVKTLPNDLLRPPSFALLLHYFVPGIWLLRRSLERLCHAPRRRSSPSVDSTRQRGASCICFPPAQQFSCPSLSIQNLATLVNDIRYEFFLLDRKHHADDDVHYERYD